MTAGSEPGNKQEWNARLWPGMKREEENAKKLNGRIERKKKAKGAWREYTTATRAATEEGFSEEAVEIATAVAAVEEGAR